MKTITIGRSSSCDIVISDDCISRIHAEISLAGNQYCYKDISKNGSSINGQMINNQKVVVAPGTTILMGNRIPLPWAQIYAQLPLEGVRPYEQETRVSSNVQPLVSDKEDTLAAGWAILSFLIPLVGWILYFCWKDTTPKRATKAAQIAWIGFGVNVILTFARI